MFFQMKNLGNLTLGDDFLVPSGVTNTCFFSGADDRTSGVQTGSVPGSVSIYCTSTTAENISKLSSVKSVHTGNYTGVPTPVRFYDKVTKSPISVTW